MALKFDDLFKKFFAAIRNFSSSEKTKKAFDITLKVLSILLFVAFAYQLYTKYAIDEKQIMPAGDYVFILLLRTFTTATVGIGILLPWFKGKNSGVVFSVFGLVIPLLNFLFFEENMRAWGKGREAEFPAINGYAYEPVRVAFFIAEQIILLVIAVFWIIRLFKNKQYIGLNPADEIIESNMKMYFSMTKESRLRFHNMLTVNGKFADFKPWIIGDNVRKNEKIKIW